MFFGVVLGGSSHLYKVGGEWPWLISPVGIELWDPSKQPDSWLKQGVIRSPLNLFWEPVLQVIATTKMT